MYRLSIIIVLTLVGLFSCNQPRDNYEVKIPSPDGKLVFYFNLYDGEPYYLIYSGEDIAVGWSWLGYTSEISEDLQKSMLVAEVKSGSGIEEEELQNTHEEPFNRLSINLQKHNVPGLEYQLEVRIFNEVIVFWYEFDESVYDVISQMIENTELDLHSKNQNWVLDDTLSMADTLKFPVKFKSDKGAQLSFLEIDTNEMYNGYLLQRKENLPEFYIRTTTSEFYEVLNNPGSKFRSGKKIIRINRNI